MNKMFQLIVLASWVIGSASISFAQEQSANFIRTGSQGTAWVISEQYVVTNNHVVKGVSSALLIAPNKKKISAMW